jgi:hypothetical protein
MTDDEFGLKSLKRVADAAIKYVTIVNEPTPGPNHKAMDAERRAFDDLEDAVQAAVAAQKEAKKELGTFSDPPEEGAWS